MQGKRETRDSMAVLETPESKETVVKVVCVGPLDPLVYPDKMYAIDRTAGRWGIGAIVSFEARLIVCSALHLCFHMAILAVVIAP